MNSPLRTRREFLSQVGQGTLIATLGSGLAAELGVGGRTLAAEAPDALHFGEMEPLVCLMQETPVKQLLPKLVAKLNSGTELRTLVGAAALANARTFGGEDYIGFHTLMALSPAFHMSREMPLAEQALPVFKVLYRNTNRIQEHGGRQGEILHPVAATPLPADRVGGELLREEVRRGDGTAAEATFAAIAAKGADEAFNHLLTMVQDHAEVHRVVLPYRTWDLLSIVGQDQAHTLLRQSVRYCVNAEKNWSHNQTWLEPREVLAKTVDEYKLLERTPGTRPAEDAWIDKLSQTIFQSAPAQAAAAVGAALAEGMAPADIGQAITLAANQLILRDMGRTPRDEVAGKPLGSVHGDSIGVHACDSANAWRNMARVANARNCMASLVLGAYQVAHDRIERGGDFLHWAPLPVDYHVKQAKSTEAAGLLNEAEQAIRGNMQAHAAALVHRYGELGHDPKGVLGLLVKYAVSEDGALHAEKFFRTASDEFASTRAPFRWRHLVALARVTASEYGRPAPGVAEARDLLKLT